MPDLINYAIELGHSCIGITDHECLSSFVDVENYVESLKKKAQKNNEEFSFKVIRGNEIYLTRNGLSASNFSKERGDDYYHFILLAKDLEGYHQLCELSTRAWMRSYVSRRMRRVPTYYQDLKDIVKVNQGHLIASTACLGGQLPKFLLKYRDTQDQKYYETAKKWCCYMQDIFGVNDFYLEMQPSDKNEQTYVNKMLLQLSNELDIPYIITNDAHYLKKEEAPLHEAYLNSQDGDREVKSFYEFTYLMSSEEISYYFKYLSPEQLEYAFKNIEEIANKCQEYSIKKPLKIPQLPWLEHQKFSQEIKDSYIKLMPTLKEFENSEYVGDKELVNAIIEGIQKHADIQNEKAYAALEECLQLTWVSSQVNKAHWSAYYLNLQKIIEECWNAGSIIGPARGSGGGFLLLYCLDIIQMNCLREKTKMYPWRFLNPQRVSVLDVDFDISGLKRQDVLKHLIDTYGRDKVCNVLTLRTEKSKSAILTAARGLGLPPEEGSYLASLIGAERGQLYSLKQMYYGSEEDGLKPNSTFVEEMNKRPELWALAQRIEGLVCGSGIHAGGVVFVDEPFTKSCSLMRAPDGTVISGYDLHRLEECSLIKYDVLSVEGEDRIQTCLELLIKYGYVKPEKTLKETYEKVIGIYNLERDDPKMWEMIHQHKIVSLFQMEKSSGVQGIAATSPESVDDLAALNSVIRLMAQEKGGESPIDKFARFKKNPQLWEEEMIQYGLTPEERQLLHNELDITYGLCISQEQFMMLVQLPELGGYDLQWADKLRKSIAKKNPKAYMELSKEFLENIDKKHLSRKLCEYTWNVLIAMNKGYGFNASHTSGYSLVALQEMNLASKYPIIFWNTANLIVDSAGVPETDEEDPDTLIVELEDEEPVEEIVDIYEPEDWEEYDYEDLPDRSAKKKKKVKSVDFGKIAAAIGKFQQEGITILPPDINKSEYSFTPIVEENAIASGLRGLTRISADLVKTIITNRPYVSIDDFMEKVKVNKLQMLTLIKCGSFDTLYPDRMGLLNQYLGKIAGTKNNLTLANVPMLIKYDVFPDGCEEYIELYHFNKFIRKFLNKETGIISLPEKALNHFCECYDIDLLIDGNTLRLKDWEKLYKKQIAPLTDFIKENKDCLLEDLNRKIVEEMCEINISGNISHCEMEAMSFYYHDHELANLNRNLYNLENFQNISENPEVDRILNTKDGKEITLYKLHYIAGTVLDKNKMKNSITLLTPDGVVIVKIWKNQYAKYDKQISIIGDDGKKKIMERSWFKRGTLLFLQGIRRGNSFIPKAYKGSPYRVPIMKILEVNDDGTMVFTNKRFDE